MANNIDELEYLIDALRSLPGVGYKTASKWAYFLIGQDTKYITDFSNRLINAKAKIKYCSKCNNLSTSDLCLICKNSYRNINQLCIVSFIEDLKRIEDSANYNGIYFVLHDEINIRTPNKDIESFNSLVNLVKSNKEINEIIIATNFTSAGQLTANKLINLLSFFDGNIYRIGLGLPSNSSLDYADNLTIKYAFINKNKIRG